MKKISAILLAACLALSLTSCGRTEDVWGFLSGLAQYLGRSQITKSEDLIGSRTLEKDAYTGDYLARCEGVTGRDVVFGGGSTETRKLRVYGRVDGDSRKAVIRIRQNEEVTELTPQKDGSFDTLLSCLGGGNYIMVAFKDFGGTVELHSEYAREKTTGTEAEETEKTNSEEIREEAKS